MGGGGQIEQLPGAQYFWGTYIILEKLLLLYKQTFCNCIFYIFSYILFILIKQQKLIN